MAVITISRQLGSHGGHIARSMANELGYSYFDKAFINKVIVQYGLTRLDHLYERKIMLLELLDEDNAMRNRFVRLFYGARWADDEAYDLVVDTSDGDDDAQQKTLAAVKALPGASPGDSTASALKVNPVLAETISNAIAWSAEG